MLLLNMLLLLLYVLSHLGYVADCLVHVVVNVAVYVVVVCVVVVCVVVVCVVVLCVVVVCVVVVCVVVLCVVSPVVRSRLPLSCLSPHRVT